MPADTASAHTASADTVRRSTPASRVAAERARETAADIRLYTEIGLAPVVCETCGVEAMVKKNSRRHTSVQWSTGAVAACPEIAAARAADSRAFVLGCPRLKDSIEHAAQAGDIVVPDLIVADSSAKES